MPSTPRIRSNSGIYHIMARGVSRCIIYEDDHDFQGFLNMLKVRLSEYQVKLHAWCLMDNHYHLLAEGDLDSISRMMKSLNSAYALYFNTRHSRIGHLFQGRFKSETVETDVRFLTTLRYIHQNPIKAGLTTTCDYRWSSFNGYVDSPFLVDNSMALSLCCGEPGFLEFHEQIDQDSICLDIDTCGRSIGTEALLDIARTVLYGIHVEEVAGLPRLTRNETLRRLKDTGMSLRQIERLTGIPKSTVANA